MRHWPSGTRALAATFWVFASAALLAQSGTIDVAGPTRADMEEFLLNARIVSTRPAGKGITNSLRATLTDGRLTHDAHIQTIDDWRTEFKTAAGTELNFRDSYRFNIAAYRLDKLLDLNMVPVSVERPVQRHPAAVTWWVENVLMDEGQRLKKKMTAPNATFYGMQVYVMRVFDQLIDNTDRNLGNMLWGTDWRLWLIDHSRAFGGRHDLRASKGLQRFDRRLIEKLRGLNENVLTEALDPYVPRQHIQALLARRDKIVKLVDQLIAQRGEKAVLYTR